MKWNNLENMPEIGTFQGSIDLSHLDDNVNYLLGHSDYAQQTKLQVHNVIVEAVKSFTKGKLSFASLKPKAQRLAALVLFQSRFPDKPYAYDFICDLIKCCKLESLCRLCYCDIIDVNSIGIDGGLWFRKEYHDYLQFIADGCVEEDKLSYVVYPLHRHLNIEDFREIVKMSSISYVRETILDTVIELQECGEL